MRGDLLLVALLAAPPAAVAGTGCEQPVPVYAQGKRGAAICPAEAQALGLTLLDRIASLLLGCGGGLRALVAPCAARTWSNFLGRSNRSAF
jgi:hypothetical protein